MAHNDDLADFVAVNGNGFGGSHSSSASNGPSPVPSMPRIEAENIRKWREQQAARLEKKGKIYYFLYSCFLLKKARRQFAKL